MLPSCLGLNRRLPEHNVSIEPQLELSFRYITRRMMSKPLRPFNEENGGYLCTQRFLNEEVFGVPYKLRIYNTFTYGLGLRALENIPLHSFVIEYIGELTLNEDLKNRFHLSSYNLERRYCLLEVHDKEMTKWTIDSTLFSNAASLVNHSCK